MYLVATVFSAVLLRKVYLFQTLPDFEKVREGSLIDMLYYSLPFGILFTIFDIVIHYIFDPLCIKYYINESKYEGKAK